MNLYSSHTVLRYAKITILVSVLSVVNHYGANLSDHILAKYIDGYKPSSPQLTPEIIFFMAAYTVNYYGFKYGWKRMLPYHICAIAVFFPLIFLSSVIRFFTEIPAELYQFYTMEMCDAKIALTACGRALAHMTFCNTMRALPLLFIIPAAFYILLKINFINIKTCYETK
ncbi:hypothetical protein [Methylomonas methanica]|uniref:Uncharacterized protein n=1 Tax=Methylomonas methanica (strain DSM 25384 / MC09) TaxID=857087 RepID=G0A6C6_METMM|nr:hypothetical protein [Methylomonas methanica]AEG01754.1 hypothetical protein Metme_3383 [Methylomonas methanica MC09]